MAAVAQRLEIIKAIAATISQRCDVIHMLRHDLGTMPIKWISTEWVPIELHGSQPTPCLAIASGRGRATSCIIALDVLPVVVRAAAILVGQLRAARHQAAGG